MGLLDRFRSARGTLSAANLHGSWHLVRSEAKLDAGKGVEMEFRPAGELVYAIDVGDRWQIMQLTYRLDGAQLITDQPSKPREERTPILLEADDTLVLGELGARTWFRRGKKSAPLSNKRLKLTGGDRFEGSGVLCPGGHGLSSNTLAPASGSPAA